MALILDFLCFGHNFDGLILEKLIDLFCIDVFFDIFYKEQEFELCNKYVKCSKFGDDGDFEYKLGVVAKKVGNNTKAVIHYAKCIHINKKIGTIERANKAMNNLGCIYEINDCNYLVAILYYILAYIFGYDNAFINVKRMVKNGRIRSKLNYESEHIKRFFMNFVL